MGIFTGARDKAKAYPFTLPDSGITGNAYGLSQTIIKDGIGGILSLAQRFVTVDDEGSVSVSGVNQSNILDMVSPAMDGISELILLACHEDVSNAEELAGIQDLSLVDFRELTKVCLSATFGTEGIGGFFADWAGSLGLSGLTTSGSAAVDDLPPPPPMPAERADLPAPSASAPASPASTTGETPSPKTISAPAGTASDEDAAEIRAAFAKTSS